MPEIFYWIILLVVLFLFLTIAVFFSIADRVVNFKKDMTLLEIIKSLFKKGGK